MQLNNGAHDCFVCFLISARNIFMYKIFCSLRMTLPRHPLLTSTCINFTLVAYLHVLLSGLHNDNIGSCYGEGWEVTIWESNITFTSRSHWRHLCTWIALSYNFIETKKFTATSLKLWSAICFKIMTRYTCGFSPRILVITSATRYTCLFFVTYTCVLFPSIWPFSYKRAYICAQKSPYTAISRKVVVKNVHATILKGNIGYDQYTVPDDWSRRIYLRCFPLALANICPWPQVPFFQISLKKSELKTTHNCRVHFFRQPFPK